MKAHSAYLGTLSPKCSVQVQSASHPKIPARPLVPVPVAVNQQRKIPRFPVARIVNLNPSPAHPMKTTIETFRAFESDGLVRLRALPEIESYFDVYGEPDSAQERQEIIDTIDLHGCWLVESEFYADGQWHHADSVGMCVYSRPLDPTENWYVEDLMRAAIDALEMQSTEGALI